MMEDLPAQSIDVLHVPYAWMPDPIGGTEIYVKGLVKELSKYGIQSSIAIPIPCNSQKIYPAEVEIFNYIPNISDPEGIPNRSAEGSFRTLLEKLKPKIVHFHARTAVISDLLLKTARECSARTVYTYHTPTCSCIRGTLIRMGKDICKGMIDEYSCTTCILNKHGIPAPISWGITHLPHKARKILAATAPSNKAKLALRIKEVVNIQSSCFRKFTQQAELIIAPCLWAVDVLQLNGVAANKIRMCRQGLNTIINTLDGKTCNHQQKPKKHQGLRIGCFSRIDPVKGLDVLIKSTGKAHHKGIQLDIYCITGDKTNHYKELLVSLAKNDSRIRLLPGIKDQEVMGAMREYDVIAVPSIWLETGPLVVLEAFGAGTPVLGSNLGGIAELVRTGVDGLLLPPGNIDEWCKAIDTIARDPLPLSRWRNSIRPQRTMNDVATEMIGYYNELVGI